MKFEDIKYDKKFYDGLHVPRTFTGVGLMKNGFFIAYYKEGEFHREDGPAVIYNDGTTFDWHLHGKLHRLDGPAMDWTNIKSYAIHGREISFEQFCRHPLVIKKRLENIIKWNYE